MARYYAALSLEQLDRNDEADKDLNRPLQSGGDEGLGRAWRVSSLLRVYDKTGKGAAGGAALPATRGQAQPLRS